MVTGVKQPGRYFLIRTAMTVAAALSIVSPAAAGATPFAPDSFWNAPLADNAPVDPQSATWVTDLLRQAKWGTYLNTTGYGVPVVDVPADQPTVAVQIDRTGPAAMGLQDALVDVPLPADAQPASGTDGTLVINQPGADRMWEFWRLSSQADGWHASWGGVMNHVSTSPGFFSDPSIVPWWQDPTRPWGASASGVALLGGLIRVQELAAGQIDHAVAMAIPVVRYKYYTWPAQRTDGTASNPAAPLEGMRFRLPPDLDIAALNLPPATAAIARAAQQYGIVLRDRSTNAVTLSAEDPGTAGPDPYPAILGGVTPARILRNFPWDKLVVLQTDIDQMPPSTTITAAPASPTSAASATFAFASDDPNVKIQCGIDTIRVGNCGYQYTFDNLTEGTHHVWAQAIDRAGLYRPPVDSYLVVDRTAPTASITLGPASASPSSTAEFALAADEANVGFECQLDGGAWQACSASPSFGGLADGSHSIATRATDGAGNVGTASAAYAWTVDTVAPSARINGFSRNTSGTATFRFSSPDASATFECRLDGSAWAACTSLKYYARLATGAHSFDVRAKDPAGNIRPPASYSWTQ